MSYERWSERSRDRRGRYLSMTWASPTAFEPDIVSSRFFYAGTENRLYMAWNYRKRVKIIPGVYLNFSKNGVSTSIGPKGAKVTFGRNGT